MGLTKYNIFGSKGVILSTITENGKSNSHFNILYDKTYAGGQLPTLKI